MRSNGRRAAADPTAKRAPRRPVAERYRSNPVSLIDGRSPDLRVVAFDQPSRFPSGVGGRGYPLTVAGAVTASAPRGVRLTVFPFHFLGISHRKTVASMFERIRRCVNTHPRPPKRIHFTKAAHLVTQLIVIASQQAAG